MGRGKKYWEGSQVWQPQQSKARKSENYAGLQPAFQNRPSPWPEWGRHQAESAESTGSVPTNERDLIGCFCKSHWVLCLSDCKCEIVRGRQTWDRAQKLPSKRRALQNSRAFGPWPALPCHPMSGLRASLGLRPTSEERMWWRRAGATWRSWSMVRRSRKSLAMLGMLGRLIPAQQEYHSKYHLLRSLMNCMLVPVRGCCGWKVRAIWDCSSNMGYVCWLRRRCQRGGGWWRQIVPYEARPFATYRSWFSFAWINT